MTDIIGRGAAEPVKAALLRRARPASPPPVKPSTISSTPPHLTISHVRLRRVQIKGAAALCTTQEIKEPRQILRGSTGQSFQGGLLGFCSFACVCECVSDFKVQYLVATGQTPTWVRPL